MLLVRALGHRLDVLLRARAFGALLQVPDLLRHPASDHLGRGPTPPLQPVPHLPRLD